MVQIIATCGQNPSLGFSHRKMCSSSKGRWNIRLQLQHHFFPPVSVLSIPQLEWLVDPGQLPGHICFLSLVDAKYRAIWLYSALCRGRGNNPLAFILPLQGACSHLFLQGSMQAETPVGSSSPDEGWLHHCAYNIPKPKLSTVFRFVQSGGLCHCPTCPWPHDSTDQLTANGHILYNTYSAAEGEFCLIFFFFPLLMKGNMSNISLLGSD